MIELSARQARAADRVGGIELMILWPAELGPQPDSLDHDHEREATPREKAVAEAMVREACRAHGLVPVHVRVAHVRRPRPPPSRPQAGEYACHLAVTIICHRWAHASTRRQCRVMFA